MMKVQIKELFKSMAMTVGGILLLVIGFSLIASFVNQKFSATVFLGPIPIPGILIPINMAFAGAGLLVLGIRRTNHGLLYFSFLGPKSGEVRSILTSLSFTSMSWMPTFHFVNFLGYMVVGLVTISAQVFPRWAGWFLAISGLFGIIFLLAGRFMHPEFLRMLFYAVQNLMGAAAIAGYGWYILKQGNVMSISR